MKKIILLFVCITVFIYACKKDKVIPPATTNNTNNANNTNSNEPNLIFKFHFDSTLSRLDNFGNPSTIPSGNSAQSPKFHLLGAHSIEFTTDSLTALGAGNVLLLTPETTAGGAQATDFNQTPKVGDGEIFYSMPLSDVTPATYKWVRVALTYQNYDIKYKASGNIYTGRIASFVDDITYITNYTIDTKSVSINSNKLQGYWGFETTVLGTSYLFEGQSAGTTVPNPIAASSPIPTNSCVVTGKFPSSLVITGNETSDITVIFNLSTNKSFEWKDLNGDGLYEPPTGTTPGDTVVDMGLRGLFPTYN